MAPGDAVVVTPPTVAPTREPPPLPIPGAGVEEEPLPLPTAAGVPAEVVIVAVGSGVTRVWVVLRELAAGAHRNYLCI